MLATFNYECLWRAQNQETRVDLPGLLPDRSRHRRLPSPQALCPAGTAAPPPRQGVVAQRLRRMGGPRSHRPTTNLGKALDNGAVRHPAALAHRLQAVAAAGALQLVQQRGHDAGAAGSEWVAERDSS